LNCTDVIFGRRSVVREDVLRGAAGAAALVPGDHQR
jgi:hypothetical protein